MSAQNQPLQDTVVDAPLKARSRILSLLGEQLIGNDQLAIFELVKNAFDADASFVRVELLGLDKGEPRLLIFDDGEGMNLDVITNVWLEPGNDHREVQRTALRRSEKFHRLPLGEKGVGRFAVHKLGNKIKLATRKEGQPEFHVEIDWLNLLSQKYLADTSVRVTQLGDPKWFPGDSHGTRIEISLLKRASWTRGDIRKVQRLLTSINSPFDEVGSFRTELLVPEREEWLAGLPSTTQLLESAPWRFKFRLDGEKFTWSYKFTPPPGAKIAGREIETKTDTLLLPSLPGKRNRVVADTAKSEGIGSISGEFVAYDKDPKIRKLLPQIQLLTDFLDSSSGIRVYRDKVRVFNYGEPEDDWLGLDLQRVNRPTERLSRNIVIGAIHLDLEGSKGLKEKTNREGFDDSDTYRRFRDLVLAIVSKFETERFLDKDRLKLSIEGNQDAVAIPVEQPLAELRKEIEKVGMQDKLLPYVERVEKDYAQVKELMLKAGMAGLNLALVFHEAERGVRSLYEAIKGKRDPNLVEAQASSLMRMFEDIAGLLKSKGSSNVDMREVVQTAARLSAKRFERHQIQCTYSLADDGEPMVIKGSADLILGTLQNLIDNSIYWLRVRWPDVGPDQEQQRRLHISITDDLEDGRALLVSDNGTGFQDDPEMLMRPFFTRRPDGMGVGMYYASIAMQVNGGQLVFPGREDVELPADIDGAVVALYFPKTRIIKK